MNITIVCSHCRFHDTDPNIEINVREGMVYHICPDCKKENKIKLKTDNKPYPRIRSMK